MNSNRLKTAKALTTLIKYPYRSRNIRLGAYAMIVFVAFALMGQSFHPNLRALIASTIMAFFAIGIFDFAVMHSRYTGHDHQATWGDICRWNFDAAVEVFIQTLKSISKTIAPVGWNPVTPAKVDHYRDYLKHQSKFLNRKTSIFTFLYWAYMTLVIILGLVVISSTVFIFVAYIAGTNSTPSNVIRSTVVLTTGTYGPGIIYFWILFIAITSILAKLSTRFFPEVGQSIRSPTLRDLATNLGATIGIGTLLGILLGATSPILHSALMSSFFSSPVRDYPVVIEPQTLVSTSFFGGTVGLSIGMLSIARKPFSEFSNLVYREAVFIFASIIPSAAVWVSGFASPEKMFNRIQRRFPEESSPSGRINENSPIDIYHRIVIETDNSFPSAADFAINEFWFVLLFSVVCLIVSYCKRRFEIRKKMRMKRTLTL